MYQLSSCPMLLGLFMLLQVLVSYPCHSNMDIYFYTSFCAIFFSLNRWVGRRDTKTICWLSQNFLNWWQYSISTFGLLDTCSIVAIVVSWTSYIYEETTIRFHGMCMKKIFCSSQNVQPLLVYFLSCYFSNCRTMDQAWWQNQKQRSVEMRTL